MMQQEQQTENAPLVSAPNRAAQGQSMTEIFKRLGSEKAEEREAAEHSFRALIAHDLKALRRGRLFQGGFSIVYCLIAFPILIYNTWFPHAHPELETYLHLTILAMFGVLGLVSLQQRAVGRRLASVDIPQAVGPLVDALATSSMFRWSDLKQALVRLLPRLKASDAKWLNVRQRKYLLRFLKSDEQWPYYGWFWGADLKIAILKALEQIGDQKAVATVERLATSSKNGGVRLAAQECLPFLRERVQQVQVEQSLLRASGPTTATDTLLRPAAGGTEAAPEQLLRPTSQ
jgi:hypothetical protein